MLVELINVSKRLDKFLLKDISFQLPKGYIMGLIGPNGAGKTSLIHLILGLYKADEGEIFVDGKQYVDNEKSIRNMTGTVLLEELFNKGLTLLENGREYGRFFEEYDELVLEKYLKRFNLDGQKKYKHLSKGEKIKFQFAFALSHNARLLVLDEPTGNLDIGFRKEFFKVLKEFTSDGERSVILSTHLTEDLDRVADYILYLEEGGTVFSGDIESLRAGYRLVIGEEYKIKLLPKESVVYTEKGTYGCRALVKHKSRYNYDDSLTVNVPSIEELMYFITKSNNGGKRYV